MPTTLTTATIADHICSAMNGAATNIKNGADEEREFHMFNGFLRLKGLTKFTILSLWVIVICDLISEDHYT